MTDPAARYRHLAARFTELVAAVPDHAWGQQSPCEDWTARDVLHHVVTTEADVLGRMPFAPAPLGDPTDLEAAWQTVRDQMQAALDTPEQAGHSYDGYFGPTTFEETIDRFYSFDLVVHAWDLARAAGLRAYEVIDPAEIEKCRADFADLEATMRQPGILGEEIEVAADADDQTAFLAFAGRAA